MTLTAAASRFAVLEVGGGHVTSAWVDLSGPSVQVGARLPLNPAGSAEEILETVATAGQALFPGDKTRWALAFPGPFDYAAGIGRYTGVGKFDALRDLDVRKALASSLDAAPDSFHFVNDADAFALGEWAIDPPLGNLVCLTLGTGVGSSFVADGACVVDGDRVPPDAELHLTSWEGRPLEETISSRAIVSSYGKSVHGAREVVEAARAGDEIAAKVLDHAFTSLGCAIAPWIDRFGAVRLTIGGAISAAWDIIEPALGEGIRISLTGPMPSITVSDDTEHAALVGAAFAAATVSRK